MTAGAIHAAGASRVRPITVAILAMGGEGGGVLADWIVDVAEHGGYLAQATSVPGVAQRTGATIYYLELFPRSAAQARRRDPVLALMPVPGDVDIVIASELMEAGRAVQRGLVTPDRTTLIASTHRVYAITEKIALGEGRVDSAALLEGCRMAARRLIAFDMAGLAEATGSIISAVLFGALAGSGALPFQRTAFEAAVRRGGVGIKASLAAFAAGYEAAKGGTDPAPSIPGSGAAEIRSAALAPLLAEVEQSFPGPALGIAREGVLRAADYQDAAYARLYLQRLKPFIVIEQNHGDGTGRLLAEVARHLALAMTYEDTIRVAELKIRPERFMRVREEARLASGQILEIAEFMHPRVQEIAETLPAPLGRWMLGSRRARALLGRLTRKGRTIRTTSISGFLLLYFVAKMKPLRPRSLRYTIEQDALDRWLKVVAETAQRDYALAVEAAECRALVKGYGETHERGRERFDALMAALPRIADRQDAAPRLAELRKAALADETGEALKKALAALGADDGDHRALAPGDAAGRLSPGEPQHRAA